jgi:hypothetical protein
MLKFAWWQDLADFATWNSACIEEVNVEEFVEILKADEEYNSHSPDVPECSIIL